jgi:hypothetical protein
MLGVSRSLTVFATGPGTQLKFGMNRLSRVRSHREDANRITVTDQSKLSPLDCPANTTILNGALWREPRAAPTPTPTGIWRGKGGPYLHLWRYRDKL